MSRTARRVVRHPLLAAGVTGLLAIGTVAGTVAVAASASAAPAVAPRWRITDAVKTGDDGVFTSVVATGKTTGWAFTGYGLTSPTAAYKLSGSAWKKESFPGKKNEAVVTAAATSPTDVWAFTQGFSQSSRVLHYNGRAWSVVKTFSDEIADATVLASNDVWVYGLQGIGGFQPALGVWHYNGSSWKQVSKTIQGGSALSATNVWGFNGVDVEHWTGRKWSGTSVKSLLPAKNPEGLNDPQVVGVLALSARDVWAIGNGEAEDEGGPVVVLHYNGSTWTRLAQGYFGGGPGPQFSSDGSGGLWLPMTGGDGSSGFLVHYSAGKLTSVTLPVSQPKITVMATSRIPGTSQQLAGGDTHASDNGGVNVVAVVLKYSA
jgi:hypothetical protein